jgi:hypothetical protein
MYVKKTSRIIPSYHQGYATNQETIEPSLWEDVVAVYAPFLGATGSKLFGFNGFKNHGTITNPTWVPRGLNLDGTAFVNLGDIPQLNFPTGQDFSGFIGFKTTQAFSAGARLLAKRHSNRNGWSFVHGTVANQFTLRLDIGATVLNAVSATTKVFDDGVLHLAGFAVDRSGGSGTSSFYLDGLPYGVFNALSVNGDLSSTDPATIGVDGNLSSGLFNGTIELVVIYNKLVSDQHAELLYFVLHNMFERASDRMIDRGEIPVLSHFPHVYKTGIQESLRIGIR